jgi:hypothetical protein
MQGTRVDTVEDVLHGEPGAYHLNDERTVLWVQLPTGSMGRLDVQEGGAGSEDPPVWGIEVHEDNTVTVTPSIEQHEVPGHATYWHGFLQRGQWVSA